MYSYSKGFGFSSVPIEIVTLRCPFSHPKFAIADSRSLRFPLKKVEPPRKKAAAECISKDAQIQTARHVKATLDLCTLYISYKHIYIYTYIIIYVYTVYMYMYMYIYREREIWWDMYGSNDTGKITLRYPGNNWTCYIYIYMHVYTLRLFNSLLWKPWPI